MPEDLSNTSFWESETAATTLRRVNVYKRAKSYRPTVVVPIINHAERPVIVQHNNPERDWGLIQGLIETYDVHPLAAGKREAHEEGFVDDGKIATLFPYLGQVGMPKLPDDFMTGYTKGGYYVFVGIKLVEGADVSVLPPPGQPQALLERVWCSDLNEAIAILRKQPGSNRNPTTLKKVEQVLIPALKSIYNPQMQEFLDLLRPIM